MSRLGDILRKHQLLLASGNAHKLAEFRRILEPRGVSLRAPVDLGLDLDVAETAEDFVGNATLKAEAFCRAAKIPALADDSGLVVDALDGEPGVRSARYGGPGLDDADRRRLVLKNLAAKAVSEEQRTARFVCVLVLCLPDGIDAFGGLPRLWTFDGVAEGRILSDERGSGGFGYDPIFYDPVVGASFAELAPEDKDVRSHRGQAVRRFLHAL